MVLPSDDQKQRRAIRSDVRDGDGNVISYIDQQGAVQAVQGDEIGPWVVIAGFAADVIAEMGAVATAAPFTPAAAEGADVEVSADLQHRLRSRLSGITASNVQADVPLDTAAAVTVGGSAPHDSPIAGFPVRLGGRGEDEVPAAVAVGDVVDWIFETVGRALVLHDKLFAGEDLVNNVLAITDEPLAVEQHSLERDASTTALQTNRVVKTSPGRVYKIHVIINTAINAARFVHVLNQTGAAAGGETPIWRLLIPPNAGFVEGFVEFESRGLYCDTGIVVAISTTLLTTTLPGAADATIHTQFK